RGHVGGCGCRNWFNGSRDAEHSFPRGDGLARGFFPGEFRGLGESLPTEFLASRKTSEQTLHFLRDSHGIAWIESNGGVAGDFRKGRDIGGDHRTTLGHRLEHRETEAFVSRQKEQGGGVLVK